jgi:hypothetical protein
MERRANPRSINVMSTSRAMLLAEVCIVLAAVLPGNKVFVELGKVPELFCKAIIEKLCTFFLEFGFALGDDTFNDITNVKDAKHLFGGSNMSGSDLLCHPLETLRDMTSKGCHFIGCERALVLRTGSLLRPR